MENTGCLRQRRGKCPGHPEHNLATGVEATTGPLDRGVASAVGMADAARRLGARHDRPGCSLVGRGLSPCGEEGTTEGAGSEAASLVGHRGPANLCRNWDDDAVGIGGPTSLAFAEGIGAIERSGRADRPILERRRSASVGAPLTALSDLRGPHGATSRAGS